MLRKIMFLSEFDKKTYGYFHKWGLELIEDYGTMASYTVAVIEKEDGTVGYYQPRSFKFVDKPECSNNA